MKRTVHAACPHDCPDGCAVLIAVEDGRATKLEGDPKHPITRGFLCGKVAKYLDRVYSPDRVLYPMRRVAKKGSHGDGAFQRITWDQAFDEIVSRLKQISSEFGSEAVLPYSYGGNIAVLNGASMDRRFFHRLGASQLHRSICSQTGEHAIISIYGRKMGTEPEQFRRSKYIIAWAANIHGNNIHLWPFIEEARRDGAKLVVIDPYRTRTARIADWHIPINPGTDVALALGLMHVIVREGWHDADYIARYAEGFDELQKRLPEYTPERVAQWTGIAKEDIERLAREYATTRPAAIRLNYGIQRAQNGGAAVRAVCMLPVITGSWKEVGGGLQLSVSGAFQLDRAAMERKDLIQKSPLGRVARTVNMVQLGKALTEFDDPPIKALVVYTRIRRQCARSSTWCGAGCSATTCSPWCMSSSSPIRLTLRTWFFPRQLSSNTKIWFRPMDITTCRFRIRRLTRWASAGRTWSSFASWLCAWGSRMNASASRWTR